MRWRARLLHVHHLAQEMGTTDCRCLTIDPGVRTKIGTVVLGPPAERAEILGLGLAPGAPHSGRRSARASTLHRGAPQRSPRGAHHRTVRLSDDDRVANLTTLPDRRR
jgi:hypothetical protein